MFLRKPILCSLLAVSFCLWANGSLASECPPKLVEISSLQGAFDFSFDDAFPIYSDSLRAELPKYYSQVRQLIENTPSPDRLFFEAASSGITYAALVETVREERNKAARELRRIAHSMDKEAQKALKAMDRGSRKGSDPGHHRGQAEMISHWRAVILGFAEELFLENPKPSDPVARHYDWEKYLSLKADFSGCVATNEQSFEHQKRWFRFSDWAYRLTSLWGELRVAMLVPGLKETNIRLQELGGNRCRSLPHYPLHKIKVAELDIELDLLLQWEGKSTWGEIKTLRGPLTFQSRPFKRVQSHAKHLVQLRDTLSPITQIRFFFVNGITPEAKAALETLGVSVH